MMRKDKGREVFSSEVEEQGVGKILYSEEG